MSPFVFSSAGDLVAGGKIAGTTGVTVSERGPAAPGFGLGIAIGSSSVRVQSMHRGSFAMECYFPAHATFGAMANQMNFLP